MIWIFCVLGLLSVLLAKSTLSSSEDQYSVAISSTLAHYSPPPYPNITEAKNHSYDQIPEVYSPLPAEEIGACSITDKYCSYNGTARNPDGLRDQCLLWDDTCSGNQTLATDRFFGQTRDYLYENVCFTADAAEVVESNCTRQNTPARFAEFKRIKDWMRSSKCIERQGLYQKAHPAPDTEEIHGEKRGLGKRDNSTEARNYGVGTCCGTCNIEAGNVEVYYWPIPSANKSCLSIIGNKVNPPDYGATTDSLGLRYWGCTKPLTGIPGESVQTVTTASVMMTGSRSWKAYLENPWDSPLCPSTSSISPGSNGSVKARDLDWQIRARGHTLVVPASVTGNDGSPVTTLVSDGMTFTSPSIYAAFSNIGAYDSCGAEVISTTMLSFAPGELSTVVGPRYFGNIAATTLPFDFADLPCPPYSVASENVYKPAPGEPYRPLIAIPSQVRSMIPWFQYCTDLWFTGFDPPKTLVPAAAMAPPITTSDPVVPNITPQASVTQDPGAKKTALGGDPSNFSPPLQHAPLPTETNSKPEPKPEDPKETNQVLISTSQTPQLKPVDDDLGTKHQDLSQQGDGSVDSSNSQSSSSGDPKMSGDPNGHLNAQSGSSGTSGLPADPNQDKANDSTSPTQKLETDHAQVATHPGSQHSSQNQLSGSEDSGPLIPTETTISLGGHVVVAGLSGVHVDSVEVNPSQPPASISGGAAINQGDSIVVASQIVHLPTLTQQSPTVIAGQTVIPIANGVSVQGKSVTGTTPVVLSGTTVSVHKSHLYIGSKSYPLPTANPAPVITLANGAIALPMSNAVSIYGTTLTADAPAATVSGAAVSLDFSSNLIFDGTAQALPAFPQPTLQTEEITTINNVAVQLLPTGISVAGTTLIPGAPPVTASGSLVSLGSTVLAIGTNSVPVSFGTPQSLMTTIGGQVVTAAPSAVEIGSVTLSPGAPGTTLAGTLVSLGSSGSLIVGSQTVVLGGATGSLGGLTIGGFGSGGSAANDSSTSRVVPPTSADNGTVFGVQTFEGKAARLRRCNFEELAGLALAITLILFLHLS